MRRLFALSCTVSLVLFLSCNDQPTSPDVDPLFAPGGGPGPPPGGGPPPGTPIPPDAGPPPDAPLPPEAGPPGLSTFTVGTGGGYSCALQNGLAYCWGANGRGQLGDGSTVDSPSPVAVLGGRRFSSLTVGDRHACALEPDGTAYCWGSNARGELGAGLPGQNSATPVAVAGGLNFVALSAGLRSTCGITPQGAAYCWGLNDEGQLGDGTTVDSNVPVAVNTNLAFESISMAFRKACGLVSGTAYCWGQSTLGDFGNGTGGLASFPTPVQAANGLNLSSINAGIFYACGVDPAGAALCWGGDGGSGKLGLGTPLDGETVLPTPVVGNLTFASLSLDVNNNNSILGHTCGVTPPGDAYCWGSNSTGQLGGPSSDACVLAITPFDCSASPVLVQGGITFAEVAVGIGPGAGVFGEHTCGLAVDGSVYCWGANGRGQLGDGSFNDSSVPVMVGLP